MIVKLLHNPSEEQIERVVEICVLAFAGSEAVASFLGGDWSLHAEFHRARARAVALEGELYVGVIETSGKIVSTASWFPPGRSQFGTEAQRALGYNEFISKLSEEARKWQTEVFPKILSAAVGPLFEKQELQKRWWCVNLATDPEYQQNGFATALMKALADKADKHNLILGLSAGPEGVRFYGSLGYRERGSVHVPAPTASFDAHIMSRDR